MLGYENIPAYWKQGLNKVEDKDFAYTTMSLNDTYDMSFRQALKVIDMNGGTVDDNSVTIKVQKPKPVALEIGFEGHYPIERKSLNTRFINEAFFEFVGIGFAVTGRTVKTGEKDHVFNVEMYIDGKLVETSELPTKFTIRKPTPFWRYQLPEGKHTVRLVILNQTNTAEIQLDDLVVYASKPGKIKY